MLKPDSLLAALTAAVLDGQGKRVFERNPDKLRIFLDKGRLVGRFGAAGNLGFEWRYRASILLMDFTGDPDAVAVAVLAWLHVHQPELLQNHGVANEAIVFEADIIDDKTVDLELQIDLTEAVSVRPRPGGGHDVEHLPEPPIGADFLPELAGQVPLGEIYAGGDLVAAIAG